MSVEIEAASPGLVSRVRAILVTPKATWAVIAVEPTTMRAIFTRYVLVLGAINPICFTLGRLMFGDRVLGAVYRPPVISALIEGLVGYAMVLGSVFALSFLIEGLSTAFGATRDRLSAFKVAAYSGTAGWLASVVYLVPPLGFLALVGQLYTLYLLYRGVQILLRPPQQRTLGFVALVVVCYIVLMMLVISLTKLLSALA